MTEQKKKTLTTSAVVLLAVIAAYTFRLIGRGSFYPTLFSYLRSFIYIGMYAAWGLSVRQRIVQKQVGRYLTSISVLLILWFSFRTVKYFIFWQPDAIRYLWYLFYLPMLFVPMLALLIAVSLGKPDSYRLPKRTAAMWIISGALLLLVLTNDIHQLVFTFPKDAAVWSDTDHGYGIGYFAVIGWQVICGAAAFAAMLFKCRLKNGRHRLWSAVPMAVSLTYLALNYIGVPWLKALFGDVTAFQSFMYMLCFETCIACGFIHSNSRYADLFASSAGTSAEITDRNFNVRYAALNTEPISKETMIKAVQSPVTADGGMTVHAMPIGGGFAAWTEDVSALLEVKEKSESLAEELAERNEILRYEYKREAKRRKVEEQNRLYDLLQSATQTQLDRIAVLTKEYRQISKSDTERATILLSEIAVLCSYIKRRKHLTLLTDRDNKIPAAELERAFSESLRTLKLLNVRSTLYAESTVSMISGKTAAAMFDFYESVIEADLENITGVQVSLTAGDGLRLSLNVRCPADLSFFANKANIRYEADGGDDYQRLVNADGGFRLAGVYRDAFEAEKHCDRTVQLVLMDVQTQHKHSGLAAAERIKKALPHIKIVVVTSLVDPEILVKAKTGAADSLWYKDHGTAELLDVVKRTLAGENVFPVNSPAVEMEGTMSDTFSPRQLDILRCYIRGLTYQEIADKFGISKNGVRWNLDDMVIKGGFENREALVATAIENKLMVTTLKDE